MTLRLTRPITDWKPHRPLRGRSNRLRSSSRARERGRTTRFPVSAALLVVALLCLEPASSASAWTFTDVTANAGLTYEHGYVTPATTLPEMFAGGVAAGDYDRDGWIDLYAVRGNIGPNLLFRNRGDGTFEEVGGAAGVAITGARGSGPTFADFDGDGWLDLIVLGVGATRPTLFRNRADGTFENATTPSGLSFTRNSVSAAFGDHDRDGDLDLFVTHWSDTPLPGGPREHLWRNNGNGTFTDVGVAAGIIIADAAGNPEPTFDYTFTPNFVDLDADGWPDLVVASDFNTSQVFHNDGDGTFSDVTDQAVITDDTGMGGAIADYDGDGDLDWFVSCVFQGGMTGNRLYRNVGNATFEDATDAAGVRYGHWGWGSTFADLDNDGHPDLFHVNGFGNENFPEWESFYGDDPAVLFAANGNGTFTERAAELGADDRSRGVGVVAFDYDRDGDLDLFLANNDSAPKLLRNDGGNLLNHLTVKLHGAAPNSEAIGARIEVAAGGATQLRELKAGSNFVSQDPAEAHFGLGAATVADAVTVRWLRGGATTLSGIAANQRLEITEPTNLCGNGIVETGPMYGEECDLGAANGTPGACCQVNCAFRPASHACRSATGACDLPEACTGASAHCPADVKSTSVCRPASAACDAAEICDGVGDACPPDALRPASEICRAAAGACDVAEQCNGIGAECPSDALIPAGQVCRGTAGVCDVPESCDGLSSVCPADDVQPTIVVCRAAAGVCDVAEHCDGSTTACPVDAVQPSSVVCRAAGGPCDAAESCDGTTVACAADSLRPAGALCRASEGACTAAGFCTGTDLECPGDGFVSAGTPCQDDGNPCTADSCDGAGSCLHEIGNAGQVCRSAAGECDLVEDCTGTTADCPPDERRPADSACVDDGSVCSLDRCDGVDVDCRHEPGNAGAPCRPAADVCDVAEICDGVGTACPPDAKQPSTLLCRPGAGACDVAERCDGTSSGCPPDTLAVSTVVCREATTACDVTELCTGTDASCPADALAPDGTRCDGLLCTLDACEAGVCVSTTDPGCLDDFQCYQVRRASGTAPFQPVPGLPLTDAFADAVFDVTAARHLCSPAGVGGDAVADPVTHLASYEIKAPFGSPRHVRRKNLEVANRLGTLRVDTRKVDMLLVPARQDPATRPPPPETSAHDVDRYKCYRVRVSSGAAPFPLGLTIDVEDGFTSPPKTYDVRAPRHLCMAVGADGETVKQPGRHLMCYTVRPAIGAPPHLSRRGLLVSDEFGPLTLDTRREDEVCLQSTVSGAGPEHSVARQWNEEVLAAIRIDLPRPPVHARNLFLASVAMWDAWAAYDPTADAYLRRESPPSTDPEGDRAVAISFAAYRTISHLYSLSVSAAQTQASLDARMSALGLDKSFTSTAGTTPAAVGNRIAAAVIAHGRSDGSNEVINYADPTYMPVNDPLIVKLPGGPMNDPNRWQPLALDYQVTQNGIPLPDQVQKFVGSQWNDVHAFALTRASPSDVYIDPGPPPQLGGVGDEEYKAGNVEVILFSSWLDPTDPTTLDISPASWGNHPLGTNDGQGYPVNPVTGQLYAPQLVKRADFARVLAEFWADGPDSETPPGHWNSIVNALSDHPSTVKRIGAAGPVVSDLEWDVKTYLALNGALSDAAVACWGVKRKYDSPRPISQIRHMADHGQSSDPMQPSYHPSGLPLVPGLIEVVTTESSAPGERHESLAGSEGEIAIHAWPGEPPDPETQVSGARWILATSWVPYQRSTFVTPPFAAYISGHSTYSRAAAEVLTHLTGSPYFPGGLGEYVVPANAFLTFERGPTTDVRLQWATFYDAADQAGLSRLYGGIHPRVDDFTGRVVGAQVGIGAWELATSYYDGTAVP